MRTTAVLLFTLIPTLAAAQGFEGAVADLQYQKYDSGSFELDSVEGHLDAAWSFGGPFGAQIGLTLGKEIDSSDDIDLQQYNGLAAHLTMDATDSLRLGVMALIDNKTPDVAFYAAEALYLAGPLRVEGRIGDSLDSDDYNLLEARGAWTFGSALSARAGYHYTDFGAEGSYRVLSLGAGYRINDGMEVYADLGHHKTDAGIDGTSKGEVINLGVRFGLGGDSDRLFSFQPLN